ncbi:hypothetical protein L1279_000639 [Planomicrobium sp. HSC-17F08]|nr:hypothetical protein G159_15990 [Planococcus glaciei CHR43]MCP2033656.1 hypothetical protein [Planomicrobium sp. HSC-17F08]
MNFDKVLELEWEDLAIGMAGSTILMVALNFFTLM